MRPRSLPWLALHLFAVVAGAVSLIGALGTPSEALQTPYGQGALAGRLIWVAIAALVIRKLLTEYGDRSGPSGPSSNPAFVPTTRPPAALRCDAFDPPALAHPAYATPPAFGPGSSYVETSAPYGLTPPAHPAVMTMRGSVPPPGR